MLALPHSARLDLAVLGRPPTTRVHDLVSRLTCQKCAKAGNRSAATLLQLEPRGRHNPELVQSLFDNKNQDEIRKFGVTRDFTGKNPSVALPSAAFRPARSRARFRIVGPYQQ